MYLYSWGTNAQNGIWTTLNSEVACEWYKDFKKQAWFGLDLSISLNQLLAFGFFFFFNCVFRKSYKDPVQCGSGHSLIRTRHKSQNLYLSPFLKAKWKMGASDRWASGSIFFAAPGEAAGRAGRGWSCSGAGASEPDQARQPGRSSMQGGGRGARCCCGSWCAACRATRLSLISPASGADLSLCLPPTASSPTAALRDDGALRFPPASPRDGFINSDSSLNAVLHLRSPCEPQELPLQRTEVLVFHQLKKSMISLWWATCFPRVFHLELYLGTRRHRVEGSIVSQASQSESYE